MSWHLLEKVLDEVSKQSTFFGKVWITLLFVFRVIAVTRMGDTVYADEQAAFKCNIKQPGCENVCFNDFSPISHVRFWGFQIIIVATPSMMFMVYAAHKVSHLPMSCKLVGRQIELPRQKSKVSKKDSSRVFSRKTLMSSLNGATVLPRQPCQKKTSGAYELKTRKYDAVKRWKTALDPTPVVELISLKETSESLKQDREHLHEDRPPAYHESSTACFYEEVPVATIPMPSIQTDCDVSFGSLKERRNSFSSSSVRNPPVRKKQDLQLPVQRLRCYSDGDITSQKINKIENGNEHQRQHSAEFNPMRSDEVPSFAQSPSQYSAPQLFNLNNFASYASQHQPLPATLIQLYPQPKDKACGKVPSDIRKNSPKSLCASYRAKHNASKTTVFQSQKSVQHSLFSHHASSISPVAQQRRGVLISRDETSTSSKTTLGQQSLQSSTDKKAKIPFQSRPDRVGYTRFVHRIENVQRQIAVAYFAQSLMRLLLETAFLIVQYLVFSFDVPELFKCERWPCPNKVDCFVSRPNEKSVMLYFMFGVTACCILLTVLELVALMKRHCQIMYEKNKMKAVKTCVASAKNNKKPDPFGRFDLRKNPHLLEGFTNMKKRHSMELFDESSSSESKSTKSSNSETDTDEQDNSFDSEDLSSMFDNDMGDQADYNNEQAEAAEAGYV